MTAALGVMAEDSIGCLQSPFTNMLPQPKTIFTRETVMDAAIDSALATFLGASAQTGERTLDIWQRVRTHREADAGSSDPDRELSIPAETVSVPSNTPEPARESEAELLAWLEKQPGGKKLSSFMGSHVAALLHNKQLTKSDCRAVLAKIPVERLRAAFNWYACSSKRHGTPPEQTPYGGMSLE